MSRTNRSRTRWIPKGCPALVCILLLASRAAGEDPAPRGGSERPNIVFVLCDDLAPWALGVAGNAEAPTPNIDRLASEGARLTSCFVVTPVCSPARAELLTSRYSTEVGILDYLSPENDAGHGLSTRFPAWPQLLVRAGYATGLVGKWHLGIEDEYHPTRFGYQEFLGYRAGGGRISSRDPVLEVRGEERLFEGFTPDVLTDAAIDFVRRHRSGPFLVSLHLHAPHANPERRPSDGDRTWLPLSDADLAAVADLDPTVPHPDYPDLDIPRVKRMMREYLGSVASIDRNVGRLLRALDDLGVASETLFVFTSDHGYNLGHNGIWHKGNGRWILRSRRSYRPNLYDHSLRVPTIVRWPGRIPAGRVVSDVCTQLDWFPTLAAVAGVRPPAGTVLRGESLLPLLEGRRATAGDESAQRGVFAQYSMRHGARATLRGFRTPRWKLVRNFEDPADDELYHLAVDPEERHNRIAEDAPEVRAAIERLDERLREAMQRIDDPALARE